MNEKVTRRKFFALHVDASVSFLGNFLAQQIDTDPSIFRPPGARDEIEFLTMCDRCGKCEQVCPEKSIKLFTASDGAKLWNTPYLNPNESPCTFCSKCLEVCSTDALTHAQFSSHPRVGLAVVNKRFCLTEKDVMCDYCARACPQNAIAIRNEKPVIDTNECNGCGLCVSSCMVYPKGININSCKENLN
ncbi:4Fe-4S dicluster domain-containing protein [Cytobacillus spongiae]|jgi:ferredoxin-type protein NapF|uniref:4Fe-4S dicluster domain-containing protein n=1 Tax=Cytobacillus spongiae TaxID=2901381 RepID=UPI001F18AAED|nr:4Fe-4S dicluster domain-containing protein [Cytobacillus spongiae]UII54268.1 4Fe-4S dicluster domain-containing protein [Cytobacillus spongiae]